MRNVSQQFPQLETEICTTASIDVSGRVNGKGRVPLKPQIVNCSTTMTTTLTGEKDEEGNEDKDEDDEDDDESDDNRLR
ncbi:hypothetical protein M0804_006831 [Polistes exclamans]|nr:hypothetical protein M0804_006831 [Polistes exclamans]